MSILVLHALLAAAALQVAGILLGQHGPEGPRLILAALTPGACLLFGLGVSGGLHKNRFVLVGAGVLALIFIYPNVESLPVYLVPIAGGAVMGRGVSTMVKPESPPPPQPPPVVQVPMYDLPPQRQRPRQMHRVDDQ